ncbi:MAG TPA: AGE family epimerase/isomerase [Sphaerochaeta sp.]|nr:AGE family epimerase/isomerase [Sphaerochaeta sp.]
MKEKLTGWKTELSYHLSEELLPFWLDRLWDTKWGGYLTQWDAKGEDSGVDEKSLLAHMRTIYSLSLAAMHGHDSDGRCEDLATRGVHFAIEHYWDPVHGGFYWLFDRKNQVVIDQKIIYGHSFAIYALATYAMAFDDPLGLHFAEACFDLLQKYGAETSYGGYWEMFERDWTLNGSGSAGGDRKTLDVHMHLMEAFTALYGASGKEIHRRKLLEIISLIDTRILHPEYKTGIPQFFVDWSIAPQIKFDIIWGWDRFEGEEGEKANALDNTSYGHNVEFFWLLSDALRVLGVDRSAYDPMFEKLLTHAVSYGVDRTHGGVFVEGSLDGSRVYDRSKEFWQQAEFLIGMLDAYRFYGDSKYLEVYENVHRFVFDKMINHEVGEWLALLEEDGTPIWSHMSHSWKVNYHTIRSVVLSLQRLEYIEMQL